MEKIAIKASKLNDKYNIKVLRLLLDLHPNVKSYGNPHIAGPIYDNSYLLVRDNLIKLTSDLTDYKIVTFEEAEKLYEKSLIPEKWCIRGCDELMEFQLNELNNKANYSLNNMNMFYYCQDPEFIKWNASFNFTDYKEITFEQFYNYIYLPTIKKEENMSGKTAKLEQTYTVTRQQMKQIHNVACSQWKLRIIDIVRNAFNEFSDEANLKESFVKEMFDAATKEQLPTLKEIFPNYETDPTLEELANGKPFAQFDHSSGGYRSTNQMITNRCAGKYKDKAFCLNPNFNWELKTDEGNVLCLIPTKK